MLPKKEGSTRHITLIDPDKQSPDVAAQRALIAVESGTSAIFVGGSTDTENNIVDATCAAIQEALELAMFASSQHPDADEECGTFQSFSFQEELMQCLPRQMGFFS